LRTSKSLLEQLARRDPTPFVHDVNVTERYGGREDVTEVRLRIQLLAQAGAEDPGVRALHMFALWYLGQRAEALLAARGSLRDLSGSIYADWPTQVSALDAELNTGSEEP
jgi:hypothetical protein